MKHLILIGIVCLSFWGCDSPEQKCEDTVNNLAIKYESIIADINAVASDSNNYAQGRLKPEAQTSFDQLTAQLNAMENDVETVSKGCADVKFEADTIIGTATNLGAVGGSALVKGFRGKQELDKTNRTMCQNMINTGATASDLFSPNSVCSNIVECADKKPFWGKKKDDKECKNVQLKKEGFLSKF